MKFNKNTFAATVAALLIGGLSVNSASAAVKTWGDLTFTTHGPVAEEISPFNGAANQQYNRTDISAITHGESVEASTFTAGSAGNYGWSDISSITHN